jgi:hypothetical protein
VAPLQAATPAYAPAAVGPALPLTPLTGTPVAALSTMSGEVPEFTPAAASPLAATPIAAAPQASSAAYTPATPPYSPATGGSAEPSRQQSAATTEQVEMPAYSA